MTQTPSNASDASISNPNGHRPHYVPPELIAIREASGLTEHERLAWIMLWSRGDRIFPSYATLARNMGVTRRTAMRAVEGDERKAGSGLIAKGWVTVTRRISASGDPDTNQYRLTVPGGSAPGSPPPTGKQAGGSAPGSPPVVPQGHQGGAPGSPKEEETEEGTLSPRASGADLAVITGTVAERDQSPIPVTNGAAGQLAPYGLTAREQAALLSHYAQLRNCPPAAAFKAEIKDGTIALTIAHVRRQLATADMLTTRRAEAAAAEAQREAQRCQNPGCPYPDPLPREPFTAEPAHNYCDHHRCQWQNPDPAPWARDPRCRAAIRHGQLCAHHGQAQQAQTVTG